VRSSSTFQVGAGLGQDRETDVVVLLVTVTPALGSLQEAVVVDAAGVVLQETVILFMVVTRYVV